MFSNHLAFLGSEPETQGLGVFDAIIVMYLFGRRWHDIMYDIAADKPGCTLEPQSYEARIDSWLEGSQISLTFCLVEGKVTTKCGSKPW